MKQYELESEHLIAEAVESSSQNLPKVEAKVKVFREQIQKDFDTCIQLPDFEGKSKRRRKVIEEKRNAHFSLFRFFEEFARRCRTVLEYLDSNLELIKKLGNLYAEGRRTSENFFFRTHILASLSSSSSFSVFCRSDQFV